jgi:WD40 repeat protein
MLVVNSNWTYGISTSSDNGSSSATLWDLAVSAKVSTISAKPLGDFPAVKALEADNLRVIILSEDKSVQICDLQSGTPSVALCGDASQTTAAVFDATGARIATGARDGTVRIWNATTGENLHTLIGHKGTVGKVSFSPDGTHLISTASAEAARVWDVASGRDIAALPTSGGKKRDRGAVQWLLSAALSTQGKRAVIGLDDATVRVWDVETGKEMLVLRITTKSYSGFIRSPVSVAINPAGTRIITDASWCMPGCGDSSMTRLWDATTGEELIEFPTYVNQFRYCAFSHVGEVAATGSTDGKVQLWDIGTGALIAELSGGGDDRNEKLCFSSDDSRLAVYSGGRPGKAGDGAVHVWDVSRWTAYDGDRAVLLAAVLGSGLGQRTEAERSDLLLQDAPDDLYNAMMRQLTAQQRARVAEVSRRLRAPLHPNCYLSHFGKVAHGES